MHLVGFIIKKFVTMHGHMKVKFPILSCQVQQTSSIYKQNICFNKGTSREMSGSYLELAIPLF
jgi:hypothetical protein